MLRRTENVSISFKPNAFTGKGWLVLSVGRQSYRMGKLHKTDVDRLYLAQYEAPINIGPIGERSYWLYQDKFYWDNDGLMQNEIYALLVTRQQRERQRIDRAQATVAMGMEPRRADREVIPDDVKQFVWARDQGRCPKLRQHYRASV